ncbi:murein L,D-transpeptidase catalytic domain family protein [Bacillus sp. NP157]|nr:murein L,D-transpeptidase catalytic domain family protein [Bacillus sp. NP157]
MSGAALVLALALHGAAPAAPMPVLERAAEASSCMSTRPKKLLVADMSQSSSQKRLWAFDLSGLRPVLIRETFVAHGRGSDPNHTGTPVAFGDEASSGKTSLGLYAVGRSYTGKHGQSYHLAGLSPTNATAYARAVVLHPAPYVAAGGRSLGCPALMPEDFEAVTSGGMDNTALWIDGPSAPAPTCSA